MIGRFGSQDDAEIAEPKGFDDYDLRLGDVMRGERATAGKSLLDVQRELKIKATYIAAIENADPTAFETPGFIAGYVRSYARYLDLDPEWAYKRFCAEAGFATAHGMSEAASAPKREARAEATPFGSKALGITPRNESFLARVEPGAIGSIAVLVGLISLLGYGGYAVLSEVQRVQVVPVDQAPQVIADIDPLDTITPLSPADSDGTQTAARDGFDRLYRPEALDVPVLVARDGPIATLDPRRSGNFASATGPTPTTAAPSALGDTTTDGSTAVAALEQGAESTTRSPQVVAATIPEVVVFAVRPSWVRVRAADGTTIFEKVMQEGDRFVLPKTEEPATLRTGESGAVYFAVNGEHYGPAGAAGSVTGNLALAADALTETYDVADITQDTALARVVVELQADPPRLPSQIEDAATAE